MNNAEKQIRKLAAELYEMAAESGQHFTIEGLTDRLYGDLTDRMADDHSVVDDLIRIVADKAVRTADETRKQAPLQSSLIDDLDRVIAVGEGRRRSLRHADNDDWANHIAIVNDNLARVSAKASVEQARYAALSPHLARGFDTEGAVAQWQKDNPDGVLP